tara:strand:+ start:32087 stop:32980 length:894 start_codon:yes stop_codon:yes gene_type:complete
MEMKSIKLITAGIALLLIAAGCMESDRSDAYGQFEAEEVLISAEVPGRILIFDVNEGDRLDEEMVIGLIDTMQLSLQKREAEAAIASVRTNINGLNAQSAVFQSQLETARKELNRIRSLQQDNAATGQQLDRAEGEVNTLQRRINAVEIEKQSVRAELDRMRIQIEQIDDQIRRAKIVNPIEGTVLQTYAKAHELASTGKPLYRIASLDEMIIRVYVSGAQLPDVRIGEEVEVLIDRNMNENESLTGTVSWIASRAEFTPRMIQTKEERVTQVYAVKVRVRNPDGHLKIGMPGEVNF